ncbi:winged helix-turn-helix domain-containing protein [Streptomyces sp. ME02-6991-2B]|nr:winged helix-turn-helix domain-containing protein [Streptomyces sp. ME02-6991-2B]
MGEIDFTSDVPRWVQIAELLRARIDDGTYPPRGRVPSVLALQDEFGVATATAQKALKALRAEGRTYTVPGLGSFVTPPAE